METQSTRGDLDSGYGLPPSVPRLQRTLESPNPYTDPSTNCRDDDSGMPSPTLFHGTTHWPVNSRTSTTNDPNRPQVSLVKRLPKKRLIRSLHEGTPAARKEGVPLRRDERTLTKEVEVQQTPVKTENLRTRPKCLPRYGRGRTAQVKTTSHLWTGKYRITTILLVKESHVKGKKKKNGAEKSTSWITVKSSRGLNSLCPVVRHPETFERESVPYSTPPVYLTFGGLINTPFFLTLFVCVLPFCFCGPS